MLLTSKPPKVHTQKTQNSLVIINSLNSLPSNGTEDSITLTFSRVKMSVAHPSDAPAWDKYVGSSNSNLGAQNRWLRFKSERRPFYKSYLRFKLSRSVQKTKKEMKNLKT